MNITNCGCPAGYTLRPTARSEGTSDNSLPELGGGLQCKQNNELACVDCEHYVRSTAKEKLDTLWDHIMSSPLIEPNNPDLIGQNIKWEGSEPETSTNNQKIYKGLCNSTVANCVYLSSLTMTNSSGFGLPTIQSNRPQHSISSFGLKGGRVARLSHASQACTRNRWTLLSTGTQTCCRKGVSRYPQPRRGDEGPVQGKPDRQNI